MRQWWHHITHGHMQLSKEPSYEGEEVIVQFCWRRLPPRDWHAVVKQDGEYVRYTPAQFTFWAKGQGLEIPDN